MLQGCPPFSAPSVVAGNDLYAEAVNDMVNQTSTSRAPWTLVEANDKYFARVKVLQTINDRLEADL